MEHEVQVLHRRPGRTFAQVVKHGAEQHLPMALVDVNAQPQLVGAVEDLRVELFHGLRVCQLDDLDMRRICIVLRQAGVQLRTRGVRGQMPQLQWNGERDALAKRAVGRQKKRALRQACVLFDLGGVFVLQLQPVDLEGWRIQSAWPFVRVHTRSAAAGIARHRVDCNGIVGGHQCRQHQGAQQRDGAGGVAAGVADTLRVGNAGGLRCAHFGQAIHPLRIGAVR
ncbi:hypothetical protein D3C71_1609660 [compost metagenome]